MGTGDRSEKIRTYNYPQNRVIDHRIGLTLNRLDFIIDGDIDEILDALTSHFQAERLKKELGDDHPRSAANAAERLEQSPRLQPASECRSLLAHCLSVDKTYLYTHDERTLGDDRDSEN